MHTTKLFRTMSPGLLGLAVLAACGEDAEREYRRALPDREMITVALPEAGLADRGLEAGSSRQGLVGAPADFYTHTYYEARNINGLGAQVIAILEAITAYPATSVDATTAVWGPFSDDNEPNEFRLTVSRVDGATIRYDWMVDGRHKSGGDFTPLAGGAFEPTGDETGRGGFVLDFEAIRSLDPTEGGRGVIGYAFEKNDEGVVVYVHYESPEGTVADYAFGEAVAGGGYILFAFPHDIDGTAGLEATENVVIRTRWVADGRGRADVLATGGDHEGSAVAASQCWNDVFVSTYELLLVEGSLAAQDGDEASCVFPNEEPPSSEELEANAPTME